MLHIISLVLTLFTLLLQAVNNRLKTFVNILLAVVCAYVFMTIDFEVLQVAVYGLILMISHSLDTRNKNVKDGNRG